MEAIWYEDLPHFFTPDTIFKILPLQTMSLEEKLNAVTRFFIYLGVILALLRKDARYLFFGILAGALSYPLYEFERKERVQAEKFMKDKSVKILDEKLCTDTNLENPFMNPTIVDIQYTPTRPEACPQDKIANEINANFQKRVFRDVTDIWGKDYSAREFYTMPNTTIPNKQGEYAEWLYGTGATCKEGNGDACERKNYRYILR